MALILEVSCSQHVMNTPPREERIFLDTITQTTADYIAEQLEQRGWVVQFNGEYMDTYCSKGCAE
jgi:hypothetical protein